MTENWVVRRKSLMWLIIGITFTATGIGFMFGLAAGMAR